MDPVTRGSHPSPGPAFPEYALPAGMSREEFRAMETIVSVLLPESQTEEGVQVQLLKEEL